MRVLQGTGLRGLCGIRPELRMGKIRLIRPLLDISKAEILDFLKNQRITFCKDSSNDSRRFLRNRLRSEIIPKLKQSVNPRLVDALARLPSVVWEENRMLDFLETTAWRKSVISIRPGRLLIRRNMLMKFPAPLQFRLLDRALKRIDPRSGLAFDAWERLRTQLVLKRYRLSLPKDIDLELTASAISLYRKGFRPKN